MHAAWERQGCAPPPHQSLARSPLNSSVLRTSSPIRSLDWAGLAIDLRLGCRTLLPDGSADT